MKTSKPTKSAELKLRNAQYRQQTIDAIRDAAIKHERAKSMTSSHHDPALEVLSQVAVAVVTVGGSISEQLCELREAVDRLNTSLLNRGPNS